MELMQQPKGRLSTSSNPLLSLFPPGRAFPESPPTLMTSPERRMLQIERRAVWGYDAAEQPSLRYGFTDFFFPLIFFYFLNRAPASCWAETIKQMAF